MALGPIRRLAAPLLVLALMPASLAAGPWVVVGSRDGQWDVFVTDDDGAVIEQITRSEGMERSAVCDETHRIIYVSSDGSLARFSRQDGFEETLNRGRSLDRLLMISPSRLVAEEIRFLCDGQESVRVVAFDLDTQELWPLIERSQAVGLPAFDPSTGAFYYTLRLLGPGQFVCDQVWRQDPDGKQTFLWNSNGVIDDLVWSDSALLVCARQPPGPPTLHIVSATEEQGDVAVLGLSDRLQLPTLRSSIVKRDFPSFDDIRSVRPCL